MAKSPSFKKTIWAVVIGGFVVSCVLVKRQQGRLTDSGGAPNIAAPRLTPGALNAPSRQLGQLASRPPTSVEKAIGSGLMNAFRAPQPTVPSLIPAASKVLPPPHLIPREPQLSEKQRRALQRLRWGFAKDLDYRGDPKDATVRNLTSVALAMPQGANGLSTEPAIIAQAFIADYKDLFLLNDPGSELTAATESDGLGGTVVRFTQRFSGYDVWPGQITANINRHGFLTVVTGAYTPTPDSIELQPKITPPAAIDIVRKELGYLQLPSTSVTPVLKIFADKGHNPQLAYVVNARQGDAPVRVFVSAITGSVLLTLNEICTAGVTATASDLFGQTRSINVLPSGTPIRYFVYDTSKPMYSATTGNGVIAIYDGSSAALPLSSSSTQVGGYDAAAVSAAFNLGRAYDFYLTAFNRNSFDGRGTSLRGIVRVPDPQTGTLMSNAYWNNQQQTMNFGAADAYAGASDVVGHELTHAVIQTSANLVYNGDSGAINESFADIFGEAFERYLYGSNDWLMGSFLRVQLRSLKSPNSKNQPATMSQYARVTTDNGGVHTNSGISNYAFYLLAEGLASGGVGFDSARNIFYRALTTKLNPRSDFYDLRSACVQSAVELFGSGSTQATKTGQSFDIVEIFAASSVAVPDNLTPPSGPDSYVLSYLAIDGNTYVGRREAALGDISVTGISNYPIAPGSRVSVTGDGSTALFVSSSHDAIVAGTDGRTQTASGSPGVFHSVAVSADGRYLACIGRDRSTGLPTNSILYIDSQTSQIETIDLFLPVLDGPSSVRITTIDEIDLSPDGQLAMFDGLARTTLGDGTIVQGWSIFGLDLRTKSIFSLAGPIANVNIGNPAFARTSSFRIVFEANDVSGNYVYAYDGVNLRAVRTFTPANLYFAYPRFSAADDFVVFTEQFLSSSLAFRPRVSRISLQADRVTPTGASSALQTEAFAGLSYRRGTFAGPPVLAVSAPTPSISSAGTGSFRITRTSGDLNVRVPVTFKAVGSARPGTDYTPFALNAIIPSGARSIDIPIRALSVASTRSLTLSLDPQYYYVISAGAGEATVTIGASTPPTISSQPSGQNAVTGGTVTLSITAAGATSFQWYRNGVPIPGATSNVLTIPNVSAANSGSYVCIATNVAGSVSSSVAVLTVVPASALSNLSVRTSMSVGQTLIVGAVINGGTKNVLVRAAGPALNAFGLPGMTDPRLELFTAASATAPLAVNDDWASALAPVFSSVGAFAFAQGSKDAAINQTLNGAFTVQCKGTGAGVVLVETYDVSGGTVARLVNVSARNRVGSGSELLIAGFAISGTGTKQVLIRGIGPGLAAFGVSGVLADPKLTVFDSSSRIVAENDNWSSALVPTFTSVGAFGLASGSKDAALIVTLNAGTTYTVQVSGADGGTGEGLVEIYEVP